VTPSAAPGGALVERPSDTSLFEGTREDLLDELLVRGILTPATRAEAVAAHLEEGGWIGHVLLAHGFCHRLELYQAWARALDLPFVNLVHEPPDVSFDLSEHLDAMLEDRWIPWRLREEAGGSVLVVVTADPERVPLERLASELGAARVELAIATDWAILRAISEAGGEVLALRAADAIDVTRPELSARRGMTLAQKVIGVAIPAGIILLASWNPFVGLATLLWIINTVFVASILMKGLLFVFGAGALRKQEEARLRYIAEHGHEPVRPWIPASELPLYTILIPAYREANVISDVLMHIRRLDYPLSKLQVILLLEADDVETIEAAKGTRTPDFMRIVVMPEGEPRTKPRALNVGLRLARGEFLVIYDAEDQPEPNQLRDVVAKFRDGGEDLCCVQARLNYYNEDQNFITRMFTLEYCLWFDYLLPGLERLKMPIPLGGTSNHFKVAVLRELGGWDSWNVTEDADLGIRAAGLGYRVGTIESTTWEEACPAWWPWIRQRTRWIKGFMVTTIVHTRSLRGLYRGTGWRGVATLFLFIAGTPAAFLLNPIVVLTGLYGLFALPLPNFRLIGYLPEISTFSLVVGTSTMVALTAASARRRRRWSIIGYSVLNPFYWLLHSTAAWRALFQLVRNPSDWEKTPHGLGGYDAGRGTESPLEAESVRLAGIEPATSRSGGARSIP
jgi:glycosyltransferase XagB